MPPDLFSFLSNAPPEEDSDEEIDELISDDTPSCSQQHPPLLVGQKRKQDTEVVSNEQIPEKESAEAVDSSDRPPKRLRGSSPVPVVVDDFRTEAKREMAASGGLTGPVEAGSRLELRHLVCTCCMLIYTFSSTIGSAPSGYSTRIQLYTNCQPYTTLETG